MSTEAEERRRHEDRRRSAAAVAAAAASARASSAPAPRGKRQRDPLHDAEDAHRGDPQRATPASTGQLVRDHALDALAQRLGSGTATPITRPRSEAGAEVFQDAQGGNETDATEPVVLDLTPPTQQVAPTLPDFDATQATRASHRDPRERHEASQTAMARDRTRSPVLAADRVAPVP
jgi:hypothetical protein